MLEGPLRALSILTSLIVLTSFALFAIDETRNASAQSAAEVAGHRATSAPSPNAQQERARELAHSKVRELIDDGNDILISPFASVADSSTTAWVRRGVPAAIALFVYGFGLAVLARYSRGRA